ncbi:nucleotidyltransferase [Meiothermus sp. CFH 77666]|uniref:nucleotidyltransferase n=1 Tax=Meiothermus sp. CFH 77666 TaxID=2817942 RepID=UPI001AA05D78|nr:nucleotidyltransferase [Meiothermus sp. CFH 77666]MBO1438283.1 nucleotidyltransferase [Meiothermus sp. CFH 77666]
MALLSRDFSEFLGFLNQNRVRYLLIGGYAVGLHGHPRYTKDLDIWVEPTQENAKNLIKAIEDFGLSSLELKPEDFLEPGVIVQIGYPPVRIDLLTKASGVEFAECYQNRQEVEIDGLKVSLISLKDLRKNKQATGRHQDLADLENLE